MGHKKTTISERSPVEIRIGEDRTRKDMGDLDALARSIDAVGLLHPIIITAGGKLVAGERRLRAVRDILKWGKVSCSVVNLDALQAEHDENQVRKDFTASERVAIAKAIKDNAGERRGRPAKQQHDVTGEIREKIPELPIADGERTADAAAKAAGFGNRKTLEHAEKVVEHGTPALVEAMDTKTVSVGAAAKIADLPPEKQEEVVEKVKSGRKPRKAIDEAVEKTSPAPATGPVDALGVPVGDHGPAFADLEKFDEIQSLLRKASKLIHELGESPGGAYYRTQLSHKGSTDGKMRHYCPHLVNVVNRLEWARPYTRCPYCHHAGKTDRNCRGCHGLGWVTKQTFDPAPEDYRKAVEALAGREGAA
jgi:ParB-like chromosome segregation protein Spo0J